MSLYRVVNKRSVYKGKTIELVEEDLESEERQSYRHTSVLHPGAVVVLPKITNNSVVMIRQYRHSIGKVLLEFPAGTLELNENPDSCAARELQEEIKYAARNWINLGTIYPAPGFCSEKQYLYFATDLYQSYAEHDQDEIIESEEISIGRIDRMIDSGEIEDGKSIAIYMRAKCRGLI